MYWFFVALLICFSSGESTDGTCGIPCRAEGENLSCQGHDCVMMPQVDEPIKLKLINMSNNHLYRFNGSIFHDLETLDLSENNFVKDHQIQIGGLMKLKHLNLASNRLNESILFSKAFFGTSISVLNLSRNRIETLNQTNLLYSELKPTLAELDLSFNRIKSLHQEAITDLTELRRLHLDGNHIKTLHIAHFMGLRSLQFLNVSGNRLTEIEGYLFQGCEQLKVLDLSHNFINVLTSDSFQQHFNSLEEIHLQNNNIQHVYKDLFNIHTLKYINLDYNGLKIVESFAFGSALNYVSIQHSWLKEIQDEVFHHSRQLDRLVIANNNNLASISSKAFNRKTIASQVVLANNSLVTIPEDLFRWSNSTEVDLSGNYWDCDCTLAWMTSYEFKSSVTCYTPLYLRHTNLNNITNDTLPCDTTKRYKLEVAVMFAFVSSCIFFIIAFTCTVKYYRGVVRFLSISEIPYKTIYRNSDEDVAKVRVSRQTTSPIEV